MRRSLLLAAALACAVPVGARAATGVPPPVLERYGAVTIVRQDDPLGHLLGVEYVLKAGLDRETMHQSGLAALTAATVLRTPVAVAPGSAPVPLERAIADRGGSIDYVVDPHDVRFYLEILSRDAPAALQCFAAALRAPDFNPATLRAARSALAARIAEHQNSALQVGLDMLDRADAKNANAGLPALGDVASLARLLPNDVATFYHTFYRRGGSVVSAVGRTDRVAPESLRALADALPAGSSQAVPSGVARLRGLSRELIAHRSVASPWLVAQYPAPGIDSKDFGPMLVLAAFVRRTLSDIAGIPGVVTQSFAVRATGAVYSYDRTPARMVLYVNGAIGDPSRTFATALSVVNILSQTKLKGSIQRFKTVAAGNFAIGATDLESRAWLAAVFAQSGGSPDFLDRALTAIAATTPQDVQRVARRYLGNPTVALVLPRDGVPLGQ